MNAPWGPDVGYSIFYIPGDFSDTKNMKMIRLRGDFDLLNDCTWRIVKAPGHTPGSHCMGLRLPKNGSGKAAFLRLLAGYLLRTRGRLDICGHDAGRDSLEARGRIGYVPESAPVYGYMRVGEFLVFMARLRGVPQRQVGDAVDRVVD